MRTRLASVTLIAAVCLTFTACSSGDGKITIGAPSGTTPTTSAGTPETSGETTETTVDLGTIPDLGSIPDLPEDLAACTELATAMSSMAMSAIGEPIPEDTKAQIEKIRDGLPDDVRKDLDTLIDAYSELSKGGDFMEAAQAVNSPEFQAASDRLSSYFQENCDG